MPLFLTSKNADTKGLLRKKTYTDANFLGYPDAEKQGTIWEWGTPEYQALLGTEIGKVMTCFVLGAFEREGRRIARIVS